MVASVILKPLPLAFFSCVVQSSRPTPEPMGAVLLSPSIVHRLRSPNVPGRHVDSMDLTCFAKTSSFMRSGAGAVSMGSGAGASASTCAKAPITSRASALAGPDCLTPLLRMRSWRAVVPAFVLSLSMLYEFEPYPAESTGWNRPLSVRLSRCTACFIASLLNGPMLR